MPPTSPAATRARPPRASDETATGSATAGPGRWPRSLEAAGVFLFTLYVTWPFLFAPGYVTSFDGLTYTGPLTTVTFDGIRAGRLPEWNDELFGGTVQLANPQAAVLYPVKWVFSRVEPQRALELMTTFHLFLLAAGMFTLLAGRLKLRPPAAFVGTVTLVGSGAIMARSLQFEQMSVIAWLPWVLVGIDAVLGAWYRPGRAVAGTALAVAMLLVAGHPQQVVISALVIAVWVGARAGDRDALRRIPLVAGAGLLGLGLAAVQLVPAALQLDNSANVGARTVEASASLNLSAKAVYLAGTVFGSVFVDRLDLTADAFEGMGFVGVAAVVLALVAAGSGLAQRGVRWTCASLTVLASVALLLALGPQCELTPSDELSNCQAGGSLYRALYGVVPGLNQERAPGRWMLVVAVSVAILAAIGTDLAVRRKVTTRGLVPSVALAVLVGSTMVAVGGQLSPQMTSSTLWAWLATAGLVGGAILLARAQSTRWVTVATVALAGLVAVELGVPQADSIARGIAGQPPFSASITSTTEFLQANPQRAMTLVEERFDDHRYLVSGMRPNANGLFGVRSIDGYDGGVMVTRSWTEAMSGTVTGRFDPELPLRWQIRVPVDPVLMARWGVRWMLVDETGAGSVPAWRKVVAHDDVLEVRENPAWIGEAFVYHRTVEGEGPTIVTDLPHLDPDTAMVPPGGPTLSCDQSCERNPAAVVRPSPEEIRVSVDTADGGLLTIAEDAQPGWQVTVDGVPTEITAVDGMNIGVVIDPGPHEVVARYRTPGLRLGGLISSVSLLIAVALASGRGTRTAPGTAAAALAVAQVSLAAGHEAPCRA